MISLHADVLHQRQEGVEDLCDAAAKRGGGEMQDAQSFSFLGELADLLHECLSYEMGVVGERLVSYRDRLEHGSSCRGQRTVLQASRALPRVA
jgi:hypothetical protein